MHLIAPYTLSLCNDECVCELQSMHVCLRESERERAKRKYVQQRKKCAHVRDSVSVISLINFTAALTQRLLQPRRQKEM